MPNKNGVGKKSPSTSKSSNNNKRREPESRYEEKTAVHGGKTKYEEKTVVHGGKTKNVVAKKVPSKASVIVDKKASTTETTVPITVKKSMLSISTAYDRTVTEEKEKEKPKKKEKEKWSGEDASIKFKELRFNQSEGGVRRDTEASCPNRCKMWQSHSSRNRHTDYKCYDHNRIIVQMCKDDYINGSKINVPHFTPSIYLVQLPKMDSVDAVEEFWRVVFHEQCQTVHIIARPEELTNPAIDKLFCQESGAWLYANGFFVNTRKVEKKENAKADMFVVELLPEGCSNAVMCSVYLHTYWKPLFGPDRFGAQIRAAHQIAKNENGNSPTVIASVNGSGRNAALLTLAVVEDQLTRGKEPKISEIVRTIREQRPQSVDSYIQYVSLYMATNWLIKTKLPSGHEVVSKIKKFNEKATRSLPGSMMKTPTEEL
ncbi:Tyrosine-protein phosphatase domain-containing protein [Caenorhabditis elegans]|uniref:Tyrosine-protein phosphatase domain-containing protein n=1 Tax=Caenorhabditis elegans TaxID=6239 RepID=Q23602_CAEEL|nr:Tyrosine-protein phosphatase domain-containing protein [Caenorhabditis elegans]CAA92641.2 Tyrosine-protein phosphatase domain-containing protein [Caenorhabditis elegans]|eukprot:NP_502200.1 Uncharacterized protein CELE_ZK809.1 [Caenorhabditis elegans]